MRYDPDSGEGSVFFDMTGAPGSDEDAIDGLKVDEAGNLWVVCPGAHALVITPAGAWEIAVRDPAGRVLNLPTNICFGGPDRRTAYIGNLPGPSLPTFRVPHPRMALVHQL